MVMFANPILSIFSFYSAIAMTSDRKYDVWMISNHFIACNLLIYYGLQDYTSGNSLSSIF